jgi:hypothetical protein
VGDARAPFRATALMVLAVEAAVLAALWLLGHYFTS